MSMLTDLFAFVDSVEVTTGTLEQNSEDEFLLYKPDGYTKVMTEIEAEQLLSTEPDLYIPFAENFSL